MSQPEPMPGSRFKEGFVEIDGRRIRYAEAGSGPIIVSIPGSGGLEMSMAKDLLARDFRVIELNQPGWGADDEIEGEHELRDIAVTLSRAAAALGAERYHVIGTSMGANIALWLAVLQPQRVLSVTLEGGETFTRPEDRQGFTPAQLARMTAIREGSPWNDEDAEIWPALDYGRKWWADTAFHHMMMQRRFKNFRHTRNTRHPELLAAIKSLRMPILTLLGDADEIIKPSVFEAWTAGLPDAVQVLIPGGRHDLQNTTPEALIEEMRKHTLRGRGGSRRP